MMGMCSWSFIWVQGCQSTEMSRCIHSLFKLMMTSPEKISGDCTLRRAGCRTLAGAVDHHGLALDADQALFLEDLQYPPDHLPGAADDAADFLAGDLDLHAIGVGHGVGLLAQVQQGGGDATGHVEE